MKSRRKKLTLTIESELIEAAKRLAEQQDSSLSQLVEKFLKTLTNEMEGEDWLSEFHKKSFPKDYKEPSDKEIIAARKRMSK